VEVSEIKERVAQIDAGVSKVIVGQETAVRLMLITLLSEGHILLEGVPGVAKTMLGQTFAAALSLRFGRIQFTPDLMPGDVLGTNIYSFEKNEFVLVKGPIFTEILLADEINRTPPKTQAALLQAMHERQVTIDNELYDLGAGFMVIATQNPIEHQGTYPLPEAQLDRFLFKHILDYPSRDDERAIVRRHGHRATMPSIEEFEIQRICDLAAITEMRAAIERIAMADDVLDYLVDVVRATREHPSIRIGASPRAAAMLGRACRANAALEGRDYVIPDDIKELAVPALRHRLSLTPEAEIEDRQIDPIVEQILQQVPAPR
jgi:MoxR-like ATPase